MRRIRLAGFALTTLLVAHPAAGQDTRLRFFFDVTAGLSGEPGSNGGFALGQYDLFLTSRLSDRFSFVGETVFEFDQSDFVADVERVIITYALNHHFAFAAGKQHTPIGYWNAAYHHGALFQPTIERPQLFQFEDEGGVLPVHTVGVMAMGRDLTAAHLGYDVMVGNGIGSMPVADNDESKSLTVAVHAQVSPTLRVGGSFYADHASVGVDNLAGTPLPQRVGVYLAGGFVTYFGPRAEAMGEYQHLVSDPTVGATTAGDALYGYVGYRVGPVVPYVRYDRLLFDPADPYFVTPEVEAGLIGARFDAEATVSIRLEIQRRKVGLQDAFSQLTGQVAVGF